jgi:hypothetical protein
VSADRFGRVALCKNFSNTFFRNHVREAISAEQETVLVRLALESSAVILYHL